MSIASRSSGPETLGTGLFFGGPGTVRAISVGLSPTYAPTATPNSIKPHSPHFLGSLDGAGMMLAQANQQRHKPYHAIAHGDRAGPSPPLHCSHGHRKIDLRWLSGQSTIDFYSMVLHSTATAPNSAAKQAPAQRCKHGPAPIRLTGPVPYAHSPASHGARPSDDAFLRRSPDALPALMRIGLAPRLRQGRDMPTRDAAHRCSSAMSFSLTGPTWAPARSRYCRRASQTDCPKSRHLSGPLPGMGSSRIGRW